MRLGQPLSMLVIRSNYMLLQIDGVEIRKAQRSLYLQGDRGAVGGPLDHVKQRTDFSMTHSSYKNEKALKHLKRNNKNTFVFPYFGLFHYPNSNDVSQMALS